MRALPTTGTLPFFQPVTGATTGFHNTRIWPVVTLVSKHVCYAQAGDLKHGCLTHLDKAQPWESGHDKQTLLFIMRPAVSEHTAPGGGAESCTHACAAPYMPPSAACRCTASVTHGRATRHNHSTVLNSEKAAPCAFPCTIQHLQTLTTVQHTVQVANITMPAAPSTRPPACWGADSAMPTAPASINISQSLPPKHIMSQQRLHMHRHSQPQPC